MYVGFSRRLKGMGHARIGWGTKLKGWGWLLLFVIPIYYMMYYMIVGMIWLIYGLFWLMFVLPFRGIKKLIKSIRNRKMIES